MSGFKVTPNTRPLVDPQKLAAFAEGADNATPKVHNTEQSKPKEALVLPWSGVDDKRRSPAFSMRFTVKEQAALKHISETTPNSMHEFCLRAIRKAIEEEMKRQSLPF